MGKYYVLYNPKSANDRGEAKAKELDSVLSEKPVYMDITNMSGFEEFFSKLEPDDSIVLVGGDGTLNRFINDTLGIKIKNDLYLYPSGTGNDFLNDIGADKTKPTKINQYVDNLPIVEINGKKTKFINGIGYGIDGYCCEIGDKQRAKGKKKINYTAIAIKGLLYGYKRANAVVTVDGVEHTYKKVWLAPTMNGRFYGGGMMATPSQDRLNPDNTVTISPMYGSNKLKTLKVFPSIFKGLHVNHTEMVDVLKGHNVTVRFDRPTALQIDGETVLGVTEYKVYADEEARKCEKL